MLLSGSQLGILLPHSVKCLAQVLNLYLQLRILITHLLQWSAGFFVLLCQIVLIFLHLWQLLFQLWNFSLPFVQLGLEVAGLSSQPVCQSFKRFIFGGQLLQLLLQFTLACLIATKRFDFASQHAEFLLLVFQLRSQKLQFVPTAVHVSVERRQQNLEILLLAWLNKSASFAQVSQLIIQFFHIFLK